MACRLCTAYRRFSVGGAGATADGASAVSSLRFRGNDENTARWAVPSPASRMDGGEPLTKGASANC